ncbi:reverse transcriptase domain-containing protein [Tanacetum coccineum]
MTRSYKRGFGSPPSSTETNPRDQVKSISTTKADFSEIRHIGCGPYAREARDVRILDAYDHTLPQKEKDPWSFTLPCFIHNICFDKALVDLGASVGVMPFSTYTNLGLGILSHTELNIELADRTIKQPRGIAENVLVRIGKFIFPIDFIILYIPEDDDVPLILGRPFLSTANSKIEVFKRKITLRVGFTIIDDDDMTKDVALGMKFCKKYASCQMIMKKFALGDKYERIMEIIFIRASRLKKELQEIMAKSIYEGMEKAPNETIISITSNEITIELSKEVLVKLQENTYHGTLNEDVVEHIAKVLEMVDLIYAPGMDSHQLRMKVFPLSLAGDAIKWWMNEGDGKITTWEELVEKFFCRFYPESYDGEDEMLNEGEDWGIDSLEFLSNMNMSFKKHKKIDGRTKKVLFHSWMNRNWNKRYVNNSISNNDKSKYENPPNTGTDLFFKAYDVRDIEEEIRQEQMKRKNNDCDNKQPSKKVCKTEKFEAIKYSLGPDEEYIAVKR